MKNCISKEQKEYIEQIEKDMLERTNMTEQEAFDFAFRCWQCGYAKTSDNNGWIPCSEILPEYTDEYNVTVDVASEFGCYKTVKTLRFEKIKGREPKWVIPKDKVYRVIAWQPLPNPYKECER